MNTGRNGEDGQGRAYEVLKQIKGVKLELGTEEVIEMKQGSWKQEWGEGEVKVGVLVWGCTECNKHAISSIQKGWIVKDA